MDAASIIWQKFFEERTRPLNIRFPGIYRALVVETNDPLCMGRIRFKCPDMHDEDLKPEECPWAVSCLELGGKQTGKFVSPCIGDWIAISFEKQHPYAPIWLGFLTPTLRQHYILPQVSTDTPVSIDKRGTNQNVVDYDKEYLPKDGRSMTYGYEDRYGNMDYSSSIGYYPQEHEIAPPPPDLDPVSKKILISANSAPIQNNPDKKYMVRATRYGHIMMMGDQGYSWKNDKNGTGDIFNDDKIDKENNAKRFLYLQKLFNENKPDSTKENADQRRIEFLTRYGHKIECRDVGWAQPGPVSSKSRPDEYTDPVYLSKEQKNDYRWIKIRTKGGMLFQAYDKGFDPENDNYVKRLLLEETDILTEREDLHWANKDARFMRMVSRHGYKIVIDDRGSHPSQSELLPDPTGNGILLKGRRLQGCDRKIGAREVGYYFEFNENNTTNHSSWGSPLGQTMEINDRYQYMMLSTRLGDDWGMDHQGIKENEFIGKPTAASAEVTSHHLKLDLDNEYIRFKTRANKGSGPFSPIVDSGVSADEEHQGFEARDANKDDGPWVEVNDCQNRGMWFSKKYEMGIWRSSKNTSMLQVIDDSLKKIVIHNNELTGEIEIYCSQDVKIIAEQDINLQAARNINLKAGNAINFQASSSRMTIKDVVKTTSEVHAKLFRIKPDANSVEQVFKTLAYGITGKPIAPSDRAKTYNGPFENADRAEIEHPI